MSRYSNFLNLPQPNDDPFIPRVIRSRSGSPLPSPSSASMEEGLPAFNFNDDDQHRRPLASLSLAEIDQLRRQPAAATATASSSTMSLTPEQMEDIKKMMELQQKQIEEMKEAARVQHESLVESQRQLQQSQDTVAQLSQAFRDMSTRPQPTVASTPSRKKPDLPPFDPKNIIVWIRRLTAAYDRAQVTTAKDKFAFLESSFPVKQNAKIDAFLYGENTEDDWEDFLAYLREEYGPTIRQKTVKLMSDNPRHDVKPSVFLAQLKEDTRDVEIDHILREHVLKTIPPRIREIMGRDVEKMSAEEVAKFADDFFDRNGKPIEKSLHSVNNINNSFNSNLSTAPNASTAASPAFTTAFEDNDDSDINFVRRGKGQGNRQRSKSRGFNNNSRPRYNSGSNGSSTAAASSASTASSTQSSTANTCRWHRRFGTKSTKCVSDCSLYQSFLSQQRQGSGNGQGGRRQ